MAKAPRKSAKPKPVEADEQNSPAPENGAAGAKTAVMDGPGPEVADEPREAKGKRRPRPSREEGPKEDAPQQRGQHPETPAPPDDVKLVETGPAQPAVRPEQRKPGSSDAVAMTVNIAKLQAMSMPDLNKMARDLGIENYGTMRKHEVIF